MNRATAILQAVGYISKSLGRPRWENEAADLLGRVGKALRVNHVYLLEVEETRGNGPLAKLRHEWTDPHPPVRCHHPHLDTATWESYGFSRWTKRLSKGLFVAAPVKALPNPERGLLKDQGVKSLALFPITVKEKWWGCLGFDDYVHERKWTSLEIEALQGVASMIGSAIEQAHHRRAVEQLTRIARSDDLTGVANRRALREIIERHHAASQRAGQVYTLVLLDIDHFKHINDTFGHAAGDQLLAHLTVILTNTLRKADWIGRWGGDEFLCLLPQTKGEHAERIMDRLRRKTQASKFEIAGHSVGITVSAGIASYAGSKEQWDAVLARADSGLYAAKRSGRNCVVFAASVESPAISLAARLRSALTDGSLRAARQPIVDLHSRETVAEGLLARIVEDNGEIIEAASFVGLAGQLRLLHIIDDLMIRNALQRYRQGASKSIERLQFVYASLDLLQRQDLMAGLIRYAEDTLKGGSVPSATAGPTLVIEIAEGELYPDTDILGQTLRPLLAFGFQFAINGSGAGLSTLDYLVDLPVSFLKIDGGLVCRALNDKRVRTIIGSIRYTAHELGIRTIAKRVEDPRTADLLRELGVDWAQGYLFGHPDLET